MLKSVSTSAWFDGLARSAGDIATLHHWSQITSHKLLTSQVSASPHRPVPLLNLVCMSDLSATFSSFQPLPPVIRWVACLGVLSRWKMTPCCSRGGRFLCIIDHTANSCTC